MHQPLLSLNSYWQVILGIRVDQYDQKVKPPIHELRRPVVLHDQEIISLLYPRQKEGDQYNKETTIAQRLYRQSQLYEPSGVIAIIFARQ